MTNDESKTLERLRRAVFGNGQPGMDEQLRNIEREIVAMKEVAQDNNKAVGSLKLEWAAMRWKLFLLVVAGAAIGNNAGALLTFAKGLF